MQLAWFKTADLYIGQGLVMLKLNSEITHIFEHAPTMTLDRVLDSCNGLVGKGTKLSITLSSSLCSPLIVHLPDSVTQHSEINVLLSASASQQLNATDIQFDCVIASNNKSFAAAIPTTLRRSIQTWVLGQKCSIASLRPLWAVVTQSATCQNSNISGVLLHEPDGSVLLVETKTDQLQTMSWRGHLTKDAMKANLQRALISFDMLEQNLLSLSFVAKPAVSMINAPIEWHKHWSAL